MDRSSNCLYTVNENVSSDVPLDLAPRGELKIYCNAASTKFQQIKYTFNTKLSARQHSCISETVTDRIILRQNLRFIQRHCLVNVEKDKLHAAKSIKQKLFDIID